MLAWLTRCICGGGVGQHEGNEVYTYRSGEVGALYLGHGSGQHLVPVGALRVKPVALAGAGAASSPRTLLRRRL